MSIRIESTTDTPEAVAAALGDLAKGAGADEKNSASAQNDADETAKTSETLENETNSKTNEESGDESELDDEGADEISESDEKKPKKKGGFRKRIDKLTKNLAARDQEIERLKLMVMSRQQPGAQEQGVGNEAPKEADSRPKADDFDSHEEFVDALTDWKLEQREKKNSEESVKAKAQSEMQTAQAKLRDGIESFRRMHPDFDEVIADVEDVRASIAMQELILASENGAELMYELAKNRDEFERINSLSPLVAARELGKIEAKLNKHSGQQVEKKTTTKAPQPIKPIGSGSSGAVNKSPDEMSYAEYKKWREQKT